MMAYRGIRVWVFCLFVLSGTCPVYAEAPTIDPADDIKHLGQIDDLLFWTPEQQVAGYRNFDKIFPTRRISAGESPYELPRQIRDLGGVQIRYQDHDLTTTSIFYSKMSPACWSSRMEKLCMNGTDSGILKTLCGSRGLSQNRYLRCWSELPLEKAISRAWTKRSPTTYRD